MNAMTIAPAAPAPPVRGRLGSTALVTGASDGIGPATVVALADSGFDVVIVARRADALRAVADDVMARGRRCDVVVADLGTAAGVDAVLSAIAARDVGCAVLAAGFGTSGAFLDADLDDELAMLDVNCRATVALAHGVGRALRARGGGALALYSSLLAFQGVPGAAHYAATKAFVQTFAEGLGRELEAHHVDVVSVAPGPVHTGFAARAKLSMGAASTPDVVAAATVRRLLRGGSRTSRPGFLAKFLEGSLSTLPRVGRVRVLELVMVGMRPKAATAGIAS